MNKQQDKQTTNNTIMTTAQNLKQVKSAIMEEKKKDRRKKLQLSWMHKMRNDEFSGTVEELQDAIERVIEDSNYMKDSRYYLSSTIKALVGITNREVGHRNTLKINQAVDRLKSLLSGIRSLLDAMSKSPDPDHVVAAKEIADWMSVFPKRAYDMGNLRLMDWTGTLLDNYNETENQSVQIAATTIGLTIYMDELQRVLDSANQLTSQRTKDLADRGESTAKEDREEAHIALQAFVDDFNLTLMRHEDDPMLDKLYNILSLRIRLLRATVRQMETKRKKRKMKQTAKVATPINKVETPAKETETPIEIIETPIEEEIYTPTIEEYIAQNNIPSVDEILKNPYLLNLITLDREDEGFKLLQMSLEKEFALGDVKSI